MDPAETLRIEVVYCPRPGQTDCVSLRLAAGSTLADALQGSGLAQRHALPAEGLRLGVWGQLREAGSLLRDRDRDEVHRPLIVDPKEARRRRDKRQRQTAP